MALLNARDVFVRRPACHSLWVAPAAAIYSRTAEELAASQSDNRIPPESASAEHIPAGTEVANPVAAGFTPAQPAGESQTYQVFNKPTQRQAETFVTHVGAVEARSPAEALALALERFAEPPAFVWWVVPDSAILRSDPAEAESLFAPAAAKPYRSPNFYHTLTQMRAVRAETEASATPPEQRP
jgi:ring-1,2-phenylacetyl-CoA epoxidase subunit PaaB